MGHGDREDGFAIMVDNEALRARGDTAPMHPGTDTCEADVDSTVHCSACEAVCCRLTVVLLPGDSVPPWFTEHDAHGVECMAKSEDGWCAALDRTSLRCSIYTRRPAICRSFAMGGAYCRDERDHWFERRAADIPLRVLPED